MVDLMSAQERANGDVLRSVATTKMPFGRYKNRVILELPEDYLLWFQQKGFPQGMLGALMALALEIKVNGLESLVDQALGSPDPRDPRSGR
jgi:hypothetical protein